MNIFPIKKIKIRTDLSREDVQRRITSTKEYTGTSTTEKFNIRRFTKKRNDYRPLIEGKIAEDTYNARSIDIVMQLPKMINIFMIFWSISCLIFGFIFVFVFSSLTSNEREFFPVFFKYIPFFMIIIALPSFFILFNIEAKRSTKDLLRILDAVPVS